MHNWFNIPVPSCMRSNRGVTEKATAARRRSPASKPVGRPAGKSAGHQGRKATGPRGHGRGGLLDALLPGKASRLACRAPVPQTDTGGWDEYSKARELNLSKELGKLAPYLR
jgi:hypothetical protein